VGSDCSNHWRLQARQGESQKDVNKEVYDINARLAVGHESSPRRRGADLAGGKDQKERAGQVKYLLIRRW